MTRAPARPAALLAITLLFVPFRASADSYKDLAKQLGKMGAKHLTEKKIAILPFDYADKRSSPGGWSVAERLIGRFVERGEYMVVERSLVEKVLGELKFQSTGVVDPETAQKIGRGLGVPAVVTGTLESLPEGKVRINARMIEVETLKIVGAVERETEQTWSDQPAAEPSSADAKTPSYNEVATAYLEHLRSSRFDLAYSLLTKKARIHVRPEDFVSHETIFGNRKKWDITQILPPVSHESGDFVPVMLGVKFDDGSEFHERKFWLNSEEGEWRVAYVDSLMTQGLTRTPDPAKAAALYSKACEILPVYEFAWRELSKEYFALVGSAQATRGKVYAELAVRAGRESVRLNKTNADAWETLGEALLIKSNHSGLAAATLDELRAIASQPDTATLNAVEVKPAPVLRGLDALNAADAQATRDGWEAVEAVHDAEEAFSTALSLPAEAADAYGSGEVMEKAHFWRGKIREAQGRFKEALADARKTLLWNARLVEMEGMSKEVLADLRKTAARNPEYVEPTIGLRVDLKRWEQDLLGKLGKKRGAR